MFNDVSYIRLVLRPDSALAAPWPYTRRLTQVTSNCKGSRDSDTDTQAGRGDGWDSESAAGQNTNLTTYTLLGKCKFYQKPRKWLRRRTGIRNKIVYINFKFFIPLRIWLWLLWPKGKPTNLRCQAELGSVEATDGMDLPSRLCISLLE